MHNQTSTTEQSSFHEHKSCAHSMFYSAQNYPSMCYSWIDKTAPSHHNSLTTIMLRVQPTPCMQFIQNYDTLHLLIFKADYPYWRTEFAIPNTLQHSAHMLLAVNIFGKTSESWRRCTSNMHALLHLAYTHAHGARASDTTLICT